MSVKFDFENALYELEQTTATLGFIQTAFAEGGSHIPDDDSAASIYMLWSKQNEIIKRLKEVLRNIK